jgi:hypothetical protein
MNQLNRVGRFIHLLAPAAGTEHKRFLQILLVKIQPCHAATQTFPGSF